MSKEGKYFGLFSRMGKAVFNNYPYSTDDKIEELFRNGDYKSFLKEKIYDIESYNQRLKKERWYSFNNIGASASIFGLMIAVIISLLPSNYASNKLFIIFILSIVIIPYGVFIILIWNDKKNYSFYYETILNMYVKDLETNNSELKEINISQEMELNETIEELYAQNQIYSNIISFDTHYLAEKFRELEFHTQDKENLNEETVKKLLSQYLDKLCKISHKLYLFDSNLDESSLAKYSACIKLIHNDDLYNHTKLTDLRFKTYVRSKSPNDELYKERIDVIGGKYDQTYEKVIDNDNFKEIIDKKRWYYYIPDYPLYYTNKNYKTSHPESIKFYKSAISFPIIYRYDEEAYILGFLCFDNPAESAFPSCNKERSEANQQIWQEFCCSQLDTLSIIISRILNYSVDKNVNNLLVLRKLRELNLSIFDLV